MLSLLPESAARRRQPHTGILLSLVAHAAAIALAMIAGPRDSDGAPRAPAVQDTIIYISPSPDRSLHRVEQPGGGSSGGSRSSVPGPALPRVPTAPVELPPIDMGQPAIDESTRWATGEAERELGTLGGGSDTGAGGRHVGLAAVAERGAVPLRDNPRPGYPERLRTAAIEGRVLIEGVVDTTGALDPAFVRILTADHQLFEQAVRVVLPRLRFQPAEVDGRRVRSLVRIPFEFRIERR